MVAEILTAGVTAFATVVVWAVRQEGRIDKIEKLQEVHEDLAASRHTETLERFARIETLLMTKR